MPDSQDFEKEKKPSRLFVFSMCEPLALEYLNMYAPKTGGMKVYVRHAGNGAMSVACARMRYKCVAITKSKKHSRWCLEFGVAAILQEQLEQHDGGFLKRKFLSRSRSLGVEDNAVPEPMGGLAEGEHADLLTPRAEAAFELPRLQVGSSHGAPTLDGGSEAGSANPGPGSTPRAIPVPASQAGASEKQSSIDSDDEL